MKRRTIVIPAVVVAVLGLGAMAATGKLGGKKQEGPKAAAVVRGSLVDKALAVGTIQPRIEVSVKSILAGVVRRRFAEVGDFEAPPHHSGQDRFDADLDARLD